MKNAYLLLICVFSSGFLLYGSALQAKDEEAKRPNVLFICVDDLRSELGCYGQQYIKSPNIDKLAADGEVFTHHLASIPTCGASRCSILTGMYPKTTDYISNEAYREFIAEKPHPNGPETFIQYLKDNGYYTVGIGKIRYYADGQLQGYNDPEGTKLEFPHSWDEMLFNAGQRKYESIR